MIMVDECRWYSMQYWREWRNSGTEKILLWKKKHLSSFSLVPSAVGPRLRRQCWARSVVHSQTQRAWLCSITRKGANQIERISLEAERVKNWTKWKRKIGEDNHCSTLFVSPFLFPSVFILPLPFLFLSSSFLLPSFLLPLLFLLLLFLRFLSLFRYLYFPLYVRLWRHSLWCRIERWNWSGSCGSLLRRSSWEKF